MSLIKPTITESLFYQFFQLDSTRPDYYMAVVTLGRSIFLNLGLVDQAKQLKDLMYEEIELPFQSDFSAVCTAFYHPKFMLSKKAYTLIKDGSVSHKITRFEMQRRFERVKGWVFDSVIKLSSDIRFTRPAEIYQ